LRPRDERSLSELRRRARRSGWSRIAMVTAFILMNVERPRLRTIADDLLAIDGIAEVYSVAGPFDLIAIARLREHEELNDLVTERVAALEGILSTETLIAFRSFSKKDLGLLWDIGS
jgi:DNA-binding Lrp family transcriptional regulator